MSELKLSPAILVIFGITGDLARKKLLAALYHLAHDGLLNPATKIVGVTRLGVDTEEIIDRVRTAVEADGNETCEPETITWLRQSLSIITMDISEQSEYERLKTELDAIEDQVGVCMNRLYYLAVPSTVFEPVVERLGRYDLNKGCQHGTAQSRLLIEKPFGYDQVSAEQLIESLKENFTEQQVYRIDHYLAKETVQNILTFRFENPLFSGSWTNHHISHVMVTATEAIGIEGRKAFYEQMGALRDIIQSHLLQLVALVTMNKPSEMTAEAIHAEKTKLLQSLRPPRLDEMAEKTVRGQYETYRQEVENDDSRVETYAALWLTIDNDRWRNVPILVRTGKAIAEKVTEITVVYQDKDNPECRNSLTIRIQPNEGIVMDLRIKKPGFDNDIEHAQMDFCYDDSITATHPDAYERVLVDALRGDKTLFATSEEVLASWRVTEPILRAWEAEQTELAVYASGTWGPDAADELAHRAGTEWLTDVLRICRFHPSFAPTSEET